MRAATAPSQRPRDAKLLVVSARGDIQHLPRAEFTKLLRRGDVLVANDAATMPASLQGTHRPTGQAIELRLASRDSLDPTAVKHFSAIVFGAGDFRTRTEDRMPPPTISVDDFLDLGPLTARVIRLLNHPRFVEIEFLDPPHEIWEGLARHGRPIQYSHIQEQLSIWDTWTPIAGPPVAFEPPSAGFALNWNTIRILAGRGIEFVTLTHAAGISSTGDHLLDLLLPFDEPYTIPEVTVGAIRRAKDQGGRVVAVGTTVVRALEHAARDTGLPWVGEGLATQKIGPDTHLRVVDAIFSGTHEPGSSHYELLRAFTDDEILRSIELELGLHDYTTHEFGDSVFMERSRTPSFSERVPKIVPLAALLSGHR